MGTNISFLNRFNFEFNYAQKNTEGQVLPVDIPVELGGFASQWQNAGTLQSTTYEASLGIDLLYTDNIACNSTIKRKKYNDLIVFICFLFKS